MLDTYFKISERGSTVGREIRGGLVTFFTMAYIVALNPLIIGLAKDADGKYIGGGDAPNLALVAAMTALMAGVLTILMGLVGNYPLALATGLGLNTFVAVGIASQMTWADAMGLVVLEGIIITILVLTGFRTAVFRAVPALWINVASRAIKERSNLERGFKNHCKNCGKYDSDQDCALSLLHHQCDSKKETEGKDDYWPTN